VTLAIATRMAIGTTTLFGVADWIATITICMSTPALLSGVTIGLTMTVMGILIITITAGNSFYALGKYAKGFLFYLFIIL
jgi:hypothetical protein